MKFKKAISLFTALAMSAALITSCGNQETEIPDGMKLAESEFVDYKLFVPNAWIVDITTGVLTAKTDDNSNVSIQTMTPSGSYKNADEYFRTDYFAKVQSTFKNVTLIEEECSTENQKFGSTNEPCVKYVYTVDSDGATYKLLQYFTYYSGYLYIFTYTAQIAEYDAEGNVTELDYFADHLEEVSEIVKNFVF